MTRYAIVRIIICALVTTEPANSADAAREGFGVLEGRLVEAVILSNSVGMKARVIAYGAALQELDVPDRSGHSADIVLSYPDMKGFIEEPQYFGASVGRYANRIANGSFVLDGKRYSVPKNDHANSLHGGTRGFDKVMWTITNVKSGVQAAVTLSYVSPDGDQGYPGTLSASVVYQLNDHNELTISYSATTDRPTVVNLTNHSYFNLAGAQSGHDILDERLMISADRYTPADAGLIPIGVLQPVDSTAFDFRTSHAIGERLRDGSDAQLVLARGYDHNFVLNGGTTATPKMAARLEDPSTGRVMELLTTEPGLQLYSGNFLDATVVGKGGRIYRQSDAVCLEPQRFPDAPNQPIFPSARLDPGQKYRHISIYRFSVAPQ